MSAALDGTHPIQNCFGNHLFLYGCIVDIQVVPGQAGGGSFQKNKPIGNGHAAG